MASSFCLLIQGRHIVQELQKESLAAAQRTKVLESENQLLLSEAEQLRQVTTLLFVRRDCLHDPTGGPNTGGESGQQSDPRRKRIGGRTAGRCGCFATPREGSESQIRSGKFLEALFCELIVWRFRWSLSSCANDWRTLR